MSLLDKFLNNIKIENESKRDRKSRESVCVIRLPFQNWQKPQG